MPILTCGRRLVNLGFGLTLGFRGLTRGSEASAVSNSVSREVLAFYYGWWGNPRVSGKWTHWKPETGRQQASNIAGIPQDGLYDSHDLSEIARHLAEARTAGVTGLISSWWGQGDFTDRSLLLLLAAARPAGIKVTAYLEQVKGGDEATRKAQAVNELLYLLRNYGNDPTWLRAFGKPVVFIYGRAGTQLPLPAWREVLNEVRAKAPNGLVAIGPNYNRSWLDVFDGGHEYNVTSEIHSRSLPQIAAWAQEQDLRKVSLARALDKISCITVIPGYDDTHVDRPAPRPTTTRQGGKVYSTLWEAAIAAAPDWVLVTSWNEWHEGSEIEPSREFGTKYLTETKRLATRFLRSG